jgi:long-chain acyl-CoA synthetase
MYTGKHAYLRPLQPAFIMANSGEAVTYAELEARTIASPICFAAAV